MSPGRLLWLLQRDLKRGWDATYHDYKTLPRIRDWRAPALSEGTQGVPVHVLTGANDWQLAAWMLASWTEFSEQQWPIFIHDDGTLPGEGQTVLMSLFPSARIVLRAEADNRMNTLLHAYPFCREYRDKHPLALKIFDISQFTPGKRFLIFDSDVLFFNYPREIVDLIGSGAEGCWFNEDVKEGALISANEARVELGIKIWPRVNSGLCFLTKDAINFDLCDRALAETSILKGHVWRIEQTLFMLCAARFGKGGLLPKRYEVSLSKTAAEDAVCRHYVGAVRNQFYAEGLNRLREQLLPLDP